MPHYVIYARKSTVSPDKQVLSIDSQVHELHELARRHGLTVTQVFTECRSAKIPGRPVFGDIMRRIARGDISGLLCWKVDRLARNPLDSGAVMQALLDGTLAEIVTPERTYGASSIDQLIGNFEFGLATKYSLDLSQTVRRGIRARLARGWLTRTPPPGYLMVPGETPIIPDPVRFPLVRRIVDEVLAGALPSSVLRRANTEWGFRTRQTKRQGGNPLSRSVFYKMLSDPFYMGVIVVHATGERLPGAHQPLMTAAEFYRIQEILGRPGHARPAVHGFTYAGLLHCARCGGLLTGEAHVKRSGRRYIYYRCFATRIGRHCPEPAIPEAAVDAQVTALLAKLAIPPPVMRWLHGRIDVLVGREVSERDAILTNLHHSLSATRHEERRLLDLRLRDLLSDAEFSQRKTEITARRADLEIRVRAPSRPAVEVAELTRRILEFANMAAAQYTVVDQVRRREILQAVTSNPRVTGRKVWFSSRKPFSTLFAAAASSNWWACADDLRTFLLENNEYFALPSLEVEPAASEDSRQIEPDKQG